LFICSPYEQDIDFCRDGVCVRGSRSYSLHYAIKATTLTCSGSLCGVADKVWLRSA
jgi:hypothetical protein